MKAIYPEETLALLAKYGELLNEISRDYERLYPDPPEYLREVLGEKGYAERCHAVRDKRRRGMLEDPFYQACIQAKTKIISISQPTYDRSLT
jgi:hypothetical protein